MTEEKLTPELRFSGFEGEWEKKKLGNISKITMGQSPKSKWYNKKKIGLPLIQGNADIKNKKTNPKLYTEKVTRTADIGDLILTVRAPVGEIAKSKHNVCIGRGVCSIKSDNSEFIYYNLLKNEKKWERYAQGSTFTAINSESINNFEIYTPIKYEQEKIGNFFLKIDKKIDLQEELIENLEEQKKGLMQKIFNQEVRFKDENGEDYPEWDTENLGDICDITTGKLNANEMVEGAKYRFYTCAEEYYSIDHYAFDTEALLISGNGANVGYVHYYNGKFNAYQRTYVLDNFNHNIIYIKHYLDEHLRKRIMGEKRDGNTPYIVMGTLSKMKIPIPSLLEQNKIADFLSLADKKIKLEKENLENYKDYKKGLMQRMFI